LKLSLRCSESNELVHSGATDCRVCFMEHKTKSVTQPPDYTMGGVGEWIASLVVWCATISMFLAIVCFVLAPTE
jgi:hypothetical protein